jgi:hypothetical protein
MALSYILDESGATILEEGDASAIYAEDSGGAGGPRNRFSMMHSYGGFCAQAVPDGTIEVLDRLLYIGVYSGLEPPVDAGGSMLGYKYERGKSHDAIFKKKQIRKKKRRRV